MISPIKIIVLFSFLPFSICAQGVYPKWQFSGGTGLGFLLKQDNFLPNRNSINFNKTNLNHGLSFSLKLTRYRNEHFGSGIGFDKFKGGGGEFILKNDPKTQYKEIENIDFSNTFSGRSIVNIYSYISLKPFEDESIHDLNFETGIGFSRFSNAEILALNYNYDRKKIFKPNEDFYFYSQKRSGFGLLGKLSLEYFYHFKKLRSSIGMGISYTIVPFNNYSERKLLNQQINNIEGLKTLDLQHVKFFQTNPNINPVNPNLLSIYFIFKKNPLRQ